MTVALTIVAILLILTLVVTLHELGHYFAARWYGVTAKAFSVGFGPELLGRTDSRGTRWKLSAIPLGGYVSLSPEKGEDAGFGMRGQVPWRGFALITVAGCLVNFLTGWLAIWALTGKVWLTFQLLGVMVTGLPSGFVDTFTDPGSANTFGGPIGLVDLALSEPGLLVAIFPIVSLSLAVINLLPLPILDGGHLLLGSIEHARGRAFGDSATTALAVTSVFVVLVLTGFVIFSDLVRVFS